MKVRRVLTILSLVITFLIHQPSPPAHARGGPRTFRIHFSVLTEHATTVTGTWRMSCWNGAASASTRGRYRGATPFHEYLIQSLPGATRCELHVVAWNIGHPHGQRPQVFTWVQPV